MRLAGVLVAALVGLYGFLFAVLGDVTGAACQGSPLEAVLVGYDFGAPDPDSLTGYDPRVAERQCEQQARRDLIKAVAVTVVGVIVGVVLWAFGARAARPGAVGLRSPDGRWWWDGHQWQPAQLPPPPPPPAT